MPKGCQKIGDPEAVTFEQLDTWTTGVADSSKHLVSWCAQLAREKGYTHFALSKKQCYSSYQDHEEAVYGVQTSVDKCGGDSVGDMAGMHYSVYMLTQKGIHSPSSLL